MLVLRGCIESCGGFVGVVCSKKKGSEDAGDDEAASGASDDGEGFFPELSLMEGDQDPGSEGAGDDEVAGDGGEASDASDDEDDEDGIFDLSLIEEQQQEVFDPPGSDCRGF